MKTKFWILLANMILLAVNASSQVLDLQSLHLAVLSNDSAIVAFNVNRHVDQINQYDDSGYTPMMYASDFCNITIMKMLMDNGADPNMLPKYDKMPPALHSAVLKDEPQAVGFMLGYQRTNADLMDGYECTPLYYAVRYGSIECARLLLDHGANPNVVCNNDLRLLHVASCFNDTAMVNLLLDYGANLNDMSAGRSVLSVAIENSAVDVANILLDNGADRTGADLVNVAAMYADGSTIDLLHDFGFDFNQMDTNGKYPKDLARIRQNRKAEMALNRYGAKSSLPLIVNSLNISPFVEFCKLECRLGFMAGIQECIHNMSFNLGMSFRPDYKPVLIPADNNVLYQLRQKSVFMHISLEKRFSFCHNSKKDCGLYAAYQYSRMFGKYDGAVTGIETQAEKFHSPCLGLYGRLNWFGLSAGYRYYNYRKISEAPEHVANISMHFYLDVLKTRHKPYRVFTFKSDDGM